MLQQELDLARNEEDEQRKNTHTHSTREWLEHRDHGLASVFQLFAGEFRIANSAAVFDELTDHGQASVFQLFARE